MSLGEVPAYYPVFFVKYIYIFFNKLDDRY